MKHLTQSQRFWTKVDATAGADACWPWSAGTNGNGYGLFYRGKKISRLAHRFALELATGVTTPQGMFVLHSCDNPPCCNPRHLRVGTHRDNVADMVARGRAPQTHNERSGKAKLSNSQVAGIREAWLRGESQAELGRRYGVSAWHIGQIVRITRRPIEMTTGPEKSSPFETRRRQESAAELERWSEASQLYRDGEKMSEIARRLGCNPATVSKKLRRIGVETRSKNDYCKPLDLNEVRRLHASGIRVGSMVTTLGAGRARIEKAMDELGLARFPSGTKSPGRAA